MAMPDNVCVGTTKTYQVNDPSVPSTYTWTIDGVIQSSTTNKLTVTWSSPGTYLITVQEHTAAGCDGDLQSGYVFVHPPSSKIIDTTVCELKLPFNWNGQEISSSGQFIASFKNIWGCDSTVTLIVTLTTQITPTLAPIGPLCQNSTAPVLPTTSINGITGTWSPATINTATQGSTTYTFTPDDGQCATPATIDVVITDQVTPTLAPIGPLCQNSSSASLPTTSTNNITGTWSPSTVNTSTVGITTYTFTPDAGQCATPVTIDIEITTQLTPTFAPIGPLCQNSSAPALPLTSLNGITGTWSPAAISTTTQGSTTYTFTPDAGQCANTATLTVTVTPKQTPTF
ncbi:hypothetical protein SAMN02745131_04231, partial [Flavisolibacter ginsengisoli DSM 18119]